MRELLLIIRRNLRRHVVVVLAAVLLCLIFCLVHSWHNSNGLMDGRQNEIWHVGNSLDLWGAFQARDTWHLDYFFWGNYWPPGFYVWPWVVFAFLGATHWAMIVSNFGHLAVLLWGVYSLGAEASGRRAGIVSMLFVVCYPGIVGNMVRYEPSVAVAAWVTVAAVALVRSHGYLIRRWSLLFALACAVGLMMDRLSLALFIALPALIEWMVGIRVGQHRRRNTNIVIALALLLVLVGYWHWEFVNLHWQEIASQGAGEIDSHGDYTELRDPSSLFSLLFVFGVLLDGQAGLVLGAMGLIALGYTLFNLSPVSNNKRGRQAGLRVAVSVVATSFVIFSVIQKKQVYYTLPMLGCLAVVTAEFVCRFRLYKVVVCCLILSGVHQIGYRMFGTGLPLPAIVGEALGGHSITGAFGDGRYPQAHEPQHLALPIDAVADRLPAGDVITFSDNPTWFEGYVTLQLRERMVGHQIRGIVGDPTGSWEWFRTVSSFVVVRSGASMDWPSTIEIDTALELQGYDLTDVPNVGELIGGDTPERRRFEVLESWEWSGGTITAWQNQVAVR